MLQLNGLREEGEVLQMRTAHGIDSQMFKKVSYFSLLHSFKRKS